MNSRLALVDNNQITGSTARGCVGASQAVGVGSRVEARDGHAGEVTRVLRDPQSQVVTHFVVRTRRFLGRELLVSAEIVDRASPETVHLDITRDKLARLPDYRSDEELAADVERALWDDDVLCRVDLASVRVEVLADEVTLRGHVANGLRRSRVEVAARRLPGVRRLRDLLVADDELEVAVAQALGQAPRTRAYFIRVRASQGVVHLLGSVPSPDDEKAAEEITSSVPGTRAIVSHLLGTEAVTPPPPVIFPPIGCPVYATDGEFGHLERVVLDPRSRRVTHLVVTGGRSLEVAGGVSPSKRRVISAAAVRFVTEDTVLLSVDCKTSARMPEYRDESYVTPPPGWQPPFDYRPEDVRFALDGPRSAERVRSERVDSA